jgi:UPF0271 protein
MMFRKKMDLNCDMGESFGNYKMGNDEEIMRYISSANVACGFHAGDPMVMAHTVKLAKENGVAIGAHPGFPDLMGFGRRKMEIAPEEARNYIIYQIGALKAFVEREGMELQHVWLHGALSSVAAKNEAIARAIIEAIKETHPELIFVHRPGLATYEIAKLLGMKVAISVGVDIEYGPDGMAVLQRKKRHTDPKEAAKKAIRIAKEGKMTATTGEDIEMKAHTILVHGDTPNAVEILKEIREEFEKENIVVSPLREILE